MSYDIEFTGSLVDKRNLPQLSTTSSLTKASSTQVGDSAWEFNGTNGAAYTGSITTTRYTVNTIDNSLGSISAYQSSGTAIAFSGSGNLGIRFCVTVAAADSVNIQFNVDNLNDFGTRFRVAFVNSSNVILTTPVTAGTFPVSGVSNTNVTAPSGAAKMEIELYGNGAGNYNVRLDYLRVTRTVSNPVTITDSSQTEGVEKSGGVGVTPTETTTIEGIPAATGSVERFGLSVVDNGTEKAKAEFLPPADTSENAYADVSDTKIITADATSLSVESVGVGAPEYIDIGSSITVEDVDGVTEN